MKALLLTLLLTLSFSTLAYENIDLQQNFYQRQMMIEMQNMRRLQENSLNIQRQEYNRAITEQHSNQIPQIINQLRATQPSYIMQPIEPFE